ncbi:hypothetical protein ACRALDRAFT_2019895 [Sodiomyces alcalophilus JCM 7366]|uniref:uncharacterized protein n=1 Tax=Sodiomyces alcalophilus JCM 7366 TaxID=591952 RepID=UPI0039B5D33F
MILMSNRNTSIPGDTSVSYLESREGCRGTRTRHATIINIVIVLIFLDLCHFYDWYLRALQDSRDSKEQKRINCVKSTENEHSCGAFVVQEGRANAGIPETPDHGPSHNGYCPELIVQGTITVRRDKPTTPFGGGDTILQKSSHYRAFQMPCTAPKNDTTREDTTNTNTITEEPGLVILPLLSMPRNEPNQSNPRPAPSKSAFYITPI